MTTFVEPGHYPAPSGGEAADGPSQIGALASRLAALNLGLTTAQRNALAGDDLWDGRQIWNVTTSRTEEYNGTAWRTVGSADLAEHEAQTNPHASYNAKSTAQTKGDLLVATASGVLVRKAAGLDGSALLADSTSADGLRWVPQTPPERYASVTNVLTSRNFATYGGEADAPAILGVVLAQSRIVEVHYSARVATNDAGGFGYACPYIPGVQGAVDENAIIAHAGGTTALIRTTVTFTIVLPAGTYDFRARFRRDGTSGVGIDSQRLDVVLR